MSKLKPCPFCGKESVVHDGDDEWSRNNLKGMVACPDADCLSSQMWVEVEEWNTRPIEAKLQAELKAVRAENKKFWEMAKVDSQLLSHAHETLLEKAAEIKELRETVYLFNSMILCGEAHTSISLARLESAMQTKIKICKGGK